MAALFYCNHFCPRPNRCRRLLLGGRVDAPRGLSIRAICCADRAPWPATAPRRWRGGSGIHRYAGASESTRECSRRTINSYPSWGAFTRYWKNGHFRYHFAKKRAAYWRRMDNYAAASFPCLWPALTSWVFTVSTGHPLLPSRKMGWHRLSTYSGNSD